jgi:hypothetical protein
MNNILSKHHRLPASSNPSLSQRQKRAYLRLLGQVLGRDPADLNRNLTRVANPDGLPN